MPPATAKYNWTDGLYYNMCDKHECMNGVRLAHHISQASMVTYHFYFFLKQYFVENIQGKFQKKKIIGNFYF